MTQRIFWPIVGVLGLALLVLVLNSGSAQRPDNEPPRPDGPPPGGPMHGRFAVAHATADRVVILDTHTGQVYVARERDFKSVNELPRGGPDRGFRGGRDEKDKEPRRPLRDRIQRFREKDKRDDKDKVEDKDKERGKDEEKTKDKGEER